MFIDNFNQFLELKLMFSIEWTKSHVNLDIYMNQMLVENTVQFVTSIRKQLD